MAIIRRAHSLALRQFIHLVFPAAVVAAGLLFVNRHSDLTISKWVVVVAATISIPPYHIFRAWYQYWQNTRKAARFGAVLPPRWDGKLPGNWDVLMRVNDSVENGYLSDFLWEQMDTKQGLGPTYDFYCLWNHDICTSDANIIKCVLSTNFDNWVKGEIFDSYMHSVLGSGVFNSDGELWKFHRTMARPFFSREKISHFQIFDSCTNQAIFKMNERFKEGYAVNFQDLISRFTMDTATQFLFGSCVNSLHGALPYPYFVQRGSAVQSHSAADKFADAFRDAQWGISMRTRSIWLWPWFELFSDRTKKPMQVVDDFLRPIIEEALHKSAMSEKANTRGENPEDEKDSETLLDSLVRSTKDPVILHDEVLNIMVAGRDTLAGMLTVAVYFLSQYPNVLRRLREEVLSQVGPSHRPTYDDIREMRYLRAFLNESMRLYPAVPWNMRYSVNDTVVPNSDPLGKPFFIPKGASISYSVHCMHRRTDYWGPDAEEFDPDRFLDERVHKYLTPNPSIFLPFNAGPRICLGQQFAYNEMSFFVVRLLQSFSDIQLDQDSQEPETRPPTDWANCPGRKGVEKFWPKSHLTVYAHGGVWLRMKEVEDNITDT